LAHLAEALGHFELFVLELGGLLAQLLVGQSYVASDQVGLGSLQ